MIIEFNNNSDEITITDDAHKVLKQLSRKEFNYDNVKDVINCILEKTSSKSSLEYPNLGITVNTIDDDNSSSEDY